MVENIVSIINHNGIKNKKLYLSKYAFNKEDDTSGCKSLLNTIGNLIKSKVRIEQENDHNFSRKRNSHQLRDELEHILSNVHSSKQADGSPKQRPISANNKIQLRSQSVNPRMRQRPHSLATNQNNHSFYSTKQHPMRAMTPLDLQQMQNKRKQVRTPQCLEIAPMRKPFCETNIQVKKNPKFSVRLMMMQQNKLQFQDSRLLLPAEDRQDTLRLNPDQVGSLPNYDISEIPNDQQYLFRVQQQQIPKWNDMQTEYNRNHGMMLPISRQEDVEMHQSQILHISKTPIGNVRPSHYKGINFQQGSIEGNSGSASKMLRANQSAGKMAYNPGDHKPVIQDFEETGQHSPGSGFKKRGQSSFMIVDLLSSGGLHISSALQLEEDPQSTRRLQEQSPQIVISQAQQQNNKSPKRMIKSSIQGSWKNISQPDLQQPNEQQSSADFRNNASQQRKSGTDIASITTTNRRQVIVKQDSMTQTMDRCYMDSPSNNQLNGGASSILQNVRFHEAIEDNEEEELMFSGRIAQAVILDQKMQENHTLSSPPTSNPERVTKQFRSVTPSIRMGGQISNVRSPSSLYQKAGTPGVRMQKPAKLNQDIKCASITKQAYAGVVGKKNQVQYYQAPDGDLESVDRLKLEILNHNYRERGDNGLFTLTKGSDRLMHQELALMNDGSIINVLSGGDLTGASGTQKRQMSTCKFSSTLAAQQKLMSLKNVPQNCFQIPIEVVSIEQQDHQLTLSPQELMADQYQHHKLPTKVVASTNNAFKRQAFKRKLLLLERQAIFGRQIPRGLSPPKSPKSPGKKKQISNTRNNAHPYVQQVKVVVMANPTKLQQMRANNSSVFGQESKQFMNLHSGIANEEIIGHFTSFIDKQ